MIITTLSQTSIGPSNIRFCSLLAIHLGISILSTSMRWVPVRAPLGTVLHIVTRFTTAVTVARDCNLLSMYTSTTPTAPTTASFWWRCSGLCGSGHGRSHSSVDSLTHHGMKRHKFSWGVSMISIMKSRLSSQCSRPRARCPAISINKLLVLGSSRPNDINKVQTIRLRDK